MEGYEEICACENGKERGEKEKEREGRKATTFDLVSTSS